MQLIINILFWAGIIALVDGSLGLLYQEKWQKIADKWNIQKIALIEISIAWALLIIQFVIRMRL